MKGLELPVNTIIIVVVAVMVLVVLAVFFIRMLGPNTTVMDDQSAWVRGCGIIKDGGCQTDDFSLEIANYDTDGDGIDDTILTSCHRIFSDTSLDAEACREKCCGY